MNNFFAVVAVAAGALAISTPDCAQKLLPGVWGAEGLRLDITAETQTIEFSCAHGSLDEPIEIRPDAEGKFDVKGTYTQERPGPEREDRPNKPQPARYSGRVQDSTMTLTITLTETKEAVGTYTLTKGKGVRIFKCK